MKKSIGMFCASVIAVMLLSGCSYFEQFETFERSGALRVGMSKAEVRQVMGEPLDANFSKPDVWYYYIKTNWHDGQYTIDECMPLVFKADKLAGWGNEYYSREKLVNSPYERPEIEGIK